MVEVPKSTGCANCLRRKKKCGEERPQCSSCVFSGWKCPGYARRWKFVHENAQISNLYLVKSYSDGKTDYDPNNHEETRDATVASTIYGVSAVASPWLFPSLSGESRSLVSDADKAALRLISILNDESGQKLCQIRSHANFIDYVPSRLGKNIALDSAVSSLCSLYVDALTGNCTTESLRTYGRAVSSLQICLKNPKLQLDSETLCASILLQVCELLIGPGHGKWIYLARGSKALFASMGPKRCTSEFERAMIESQRLWFVSYLEVGLYAAENRWLNDVTFYKTKMLQDLGDRQHCFLAQPEWRRVFASHMVMPVDTRNPRLSLRSKFCEMLVDIPDLLSEVSRVIISMENGETSDDIQANRKTILNRVISQKYRIETWYMNDLEPLILGGGNSRYPNILVAVMDFLSCSALLHLYDALSAISPALPRYACSGNITIDELAITKWRNSIRESLAFAGENSWVISEPLKYGLSQVDRQCLVSS